MLRPENNPELRRWILSGVCRRAFEAGSIVELLSSTIQAAIDNAPVPRTPFEAMDATMLLIGNRVVDVDGVAQLRPATDYPLLLLESPQQFQRVLVHLVNRGLIHYSGELSHDRAVLTLEGWSYLDQLQRTGVKSRQAFIAMAFRDELDVPYAEGFAPAVEATGLQPFRIDRVPHNDRIDEKIIAEIRRSGVLVADFTHHRPSVYFEAGLAQGLGLHVIRTCRKDHLEQAHFDTRQYYHVGWETAADLRESLETHIRATVPLELLRDGGHASAQGPAE